MSPQRTVIVASRPPLSSNYLTHSISFKLFFTFLFLLLLQEVISFSFKLRVSSLTTAGISFTARAGGKCHARRKQQLLLWKSGR